MFSLRVKIFQFSEKKAERKKFKQTCPVPAMILRIQLLHGETEFENV